MSQQFEAVIGLEVHAQLLTETKAFCGCSTKFGNPPNTNVCPVCLGHPGVLPVMNKKMIEFAVLMGLATNCEIKNRSIFERKNYFYPDLPKGYQTSQFAEPICENGLIEVVTSQGEKKNIRIKRIHLEEDAGKSIHDQGFETLVDVNRCGVPLIEIVTEPDINTAEEAYLYLIKIKQLVQYLNICDGNMEEGSLRCDANVSIRPIGETKLGTKTEIKNLNSFRNVERSINFEIERQKELIEENKKITQQTLLWNADLNEAFPMRSKEEANDYRYFPDPDLLPVIVTEDWKNEIAKQLPELPDEKRNRYAAQFNLPEYDSTVLTQTKDLAEYFEKVITVTKDYKSASNWVMGEVLKNINEQKITAEEFIIKPENIGKLINLISEGTISGKIAKDVFAEMLIENKEPLEIVKEKNLIQISDKSEIDKIINEILEKNSAQVEQYKNGEEKVFGFFVGQTMKATKGKANPKLVNDLLKEKLDSLKN